MHKTKVYLYCLFDKLSGNTVYYNVSENDFSEVLRILQTTHIPLKDSVLLRLGELETSIPPSSPDVTPNLDFSQCLSYTFYEKPVVVSWNVLSLPENKADALAPLGLPPDQVENIVRTHQNAMNLNTSTREV